MLIVDIYNAVAELLARGVHPSVTRIRDSLTTCSPGDDFWRVLNVYTEFFSLQPSASGYRWQIRLKLMPAQAQKLLEKEELMFRSWPSADGVSTTAKAKKPGGS